MEYNRLMSQTPGQKLKIIRESMGVTLDEISQKTHIRLKYLEAIETDDQEVLSSTAQMRGFLRLYANQLGVDLEELAVEGYQALEVPAEESSLDIPPEEVTDKDTIPEEPQEALKTEDLDEVLVTPETPQTEPKGIPHDDLFEIKELGETGHASSIFKALGAKLQARRKLLSLSHKDIAETLHIREEFLKALEGGDFDALPSAVQARGMLINYADFLNLDVEAILLQYAEGLQVRRLEKQEKSVQQDKHTAKQLSPTRLRLKNFFSLDLLVIAGLFLVFAIFVIWGVNRIMSTNSPDTASTEIPEVADVLLATGSPTPALTITPDLTELAEEPVDATQEEPTPIFTSAPNTDSINIIIIPRQQTWVQITSDGEIAFVGRLITGNVYDFSGNNFVEVLTGNAGALQIYFNDEDIGSPGLIGQVVTLVFTETGLVQPTPTNTPTITETPRPTPSPTVTPTATQTRMPTLTPTEIDD